MSSLRPPATRRLTAALLLATSTAIAPVAASEYEQVPPIRDPLVAKECSACHMLYPAALLPAESWRSMMSGLADHFGENAELTPDVAQKITDYLTANASYAKIRSGDPVPIRISEMSWFRRKHDKKGRIAPETLKRRGAKSPSDCKACHLDAEAGYFED